MDTNLIILDRLPFYHIFTNMDRTDRSFIGFSHQLLDLRVEIVDYSLVKLQKLIHFLSVLISDFEKTFLVVFFYFYWIFYLPSLYFRCSHQVLDISSLFPYFNVGISVQSGQIFLYWV